jgi:hypothetical protein
MKIACHPFIGALACCLPISLSPSCKKADPTIVEIHELQLKEGQTVRTIMETLTENGTVKIVGGKQNGTGEMFIQRVRIFEKTRTKDGYKYDIQQNDSAASFRWGDQEHPSETHSALIGRPVTAKHGEDGWQLTLAEGNASPEQESEIEAFEAYANRDWLPGHPVEVGDSWPCKAGFIHHFINSDTTHTDASGTLTLLAIKDGNAAVSIHIEGKGTQVDEKKGTISKAGLDLRGTVVFSIKTGLDSVLDLKGKVTSGVQYSNGEIKAVLLPVEIKVRKKILD